MNSATNSESSAAPSTGAVSRHQAEGASASLSRRTFHNLSLGCRKPSKTKDKAEKTGKSKLSWTLRWRLKPQEAVEQPREPMIDLNRFNPADYPIEDKEEVARRVRAREIAEGIEMEIESLPISYRTVPDATAAAVVPESDPTTTSRTANQQSTEAEPSPNSVDQPAPGEAAAIEPEEATSAIAAVQPNVSASMIIEGLTVLLHRSLAISMDSQRAWNVLTHGDLHFLVQHFHWHQHQHGPQVG